jgi:glycosyltransferase involved in cell wall biosynthesis
LSRDFERELAGQLRDFFSCRRLIGDIVRGAEDLKTVKAAVIKFKPDVIFLQTLLYPCYLAYHLPRSIPIMVTFWNGDLTWWAQWNGIERISKRALVKHGIRRACAITVNSSTARETCLDYGARKEKVFLVRYPGVELERFRPHAKSSAKNEIGIVHEKVVLCPRGLGGYLNSDMIIEAVREVVRRFPDTLFLFLSRKGDEKQWNDHFERARLLGVAGNIRCDGQVPWEAMPTYYNAADVMISVSSYDSLPNCLLEAMACEVPVIMSDLRQIREWVTDGVNGYIVPPRNSEILSDRIIKVFEDGEERMRIFGRHNSKLVTEFADSEKNSEEIRDLVHKVAETGRIDSRDTNSRSRSSLAPDV